MCCQEVNIWTRRLFKAQILCTTKYSEDHKSHLRVYPFSVHRGQVVELAQVPVDCCAEKENVVCIENNIILDP